MSLFLAVDDIRDWVIVVYGVAGIIFFVFALVISLVMFFTLKGLVSAVRGALDESVVPALHSVKDAADTVRGTTDFVGRTAVAPIFKAYGTFAGLKKGLSVLGNLKGRGKP